MVKLQRPFTSRGARAAAEPCAECWRGFCPCCKRPLEAKLVRDGAPAQREEVPEGVRGRFAYVITLWGSSREYLLGALVLGHSIRQTGTPHRLVCLHTEDVPAGFIELLSKVWDCRLVQHVDAARTLSWAEQDARFEKVFTKLRGLGLVEFEKVLMLDIDLLVLSNIDELFRLPAPAALKRGMNEGSYWPYKHGDPIDGRSFFSGAVPGKAHSWGQGTGINAGVMLWQPSRKVLQAMLEELAEPGHPGHCRGNGPEQDYLSRYWADAPWTNIAVEYNFQLHHMFNALHPDTILRAERIRCITDPSRIKVVHFSGESAAKPWHRVLDQRFAEMWPDRSQDEAYADIFVKEFHGYWLWVVRDKSAWDKVDETRRWGGMNSHIARGDDGLLYRSDEPARKAAADADGGAGAAAAAAGGDREGEEVWVPVCLPEETLQGALKALRLCLAAWFDAFTSAERRLGLDLPAALFAAAPTAPPASTKTGAPGGVSWKSTWFAKLPTPARTGGDGGPPGADGTAAPVGARRLQWHRAEGGWVHEQERQAAGGLAFKPAKASVACGGREGASFVVFSWGEDGCDSYFASSGEEVCGVFVKVLGRASRCFPLADGDLSPLRIWADGINEGAAMLLAIVGLEAKHLEQALAVLAPLGVPPGPVRADCRVLAAAGLTCGPAPWEAAHASSDAAYASVLVPE